MHFKTLFIICLISFCTFSQDIIEEIDTTDIAASEQSEAVETADTPESETPVLESVEETDTAGMYSPIKEETVGEPEPFPEPEETITPVQQEKVNLAETIPEAPTRPIAQTVIGGLLTGNGALVLVLDLILIGMMSSTYDEIPPQDRSSLAIIAIGGGAQLISGIALLGVAMPKWKEYNEWEAKYQKKSMKGIQINFTVNF